MTPVRPAVAAILLAAALACAGCGSRTPAPAPAPAAGAATPGAVAAGPAAGAQTPADQGAAGKTPAGAAAPGAAAAGEAPAATGAAALTGPAAAPTEPSRREVLLFFALSDDDALAPERRKILLSDSIEDQAKQIVGELAAGPRREGLLPTIPAGTKVLGLYLDRAGTAFVDLSEEFVTLHPGGSSEEIATIFSIVDSLTYNLKEIRRVRFLVGGEERDTLRNHLDLRRAFIADMSAVKMDAGDTAPGGGGR